MKKVSSDSLKQKIAEFEGLYLSAYKCPAGIPTIGIGHTKNVEIGTSITKEQAMSLLEEDLKPCEKFVNNMSVSLSQSQFDALVDFCFNLGTAALHNSTLYKYIIGGQSDEMIIKEFGKWVYSKGKKLAGLVKRREWEASMWKNKRI